MSWRGALVWKGILVATNLCVPREQHVAVKLISGQSLDSHSSLSLKWAN